MKELFKGFYRLSEEEFAELWETALFILDASFLCNLYRLPVDTRNELIEALKKVSDRLWVPNHAALEFHRNRQKVIADQNKKFAELRKVFKDTKSKFENGLSKLKLKKRHSLIDPDSLENKFNELLNTFEKEISELEKEHMDAFKGDPILQDLDNLLDGRFGVPTENQNEVDKIYEEGQDRYSKKIPPGYMDADKAEDKAKDKEGDYHEYGGIIYRRQFGDFLIWKQILKETKSRETKSVIFLTDDMKEDWYSIVEEKKLGPRPELVDEISREAGVVYFHIYNSEQFLRFAGQYLEIDISEESIQAAKDVAEALRTDSCDLCGEKIPPGEIHETDDLVRLCKNCFKYIEVLPDGKIKESIKEFLKGNIIA